MKPFRFSQKSLGDLDAETASTLIVAAVDIALVIDGAGLIRDVAIRNDEFAALLKGYAEWLDKPFLETVSSESRPKVEALLQEATSSREPRWRSVNHATSDGASIRTVTARCRSPRMAGSWRSAVIFRRSLRSSRGLWTRSSRSSRIMRACATRSCATVCSSRPRPKPS